MAFALDQATLQELEKNRQLMQQMQQQQQQATQPAQQTSGRGGFLTSLISELGGAGGAAGGAAIGTAIAPGIGTIIGAGLGGLVGGFGGSAAEQEVRNGNVNYGNALKEGGLDALFSVGGEAAPLVKGELAAAKAAKSALPGTAGELFASAAPEGVAAGTRVPGFLQNTGNELVQSGLGLNTGAGSGAGKLGASASNDLVGTLKTLGVPLSSPKNTQAALEGKINQLGTALQGAYSAADKTIPIAPSDVQNLAMGILQKVSTTGALSDADRNYALNEMQTLVKNGGSLTDLWKYTQDIESHINMGRASTSAEPTHEAVNQIIKDNVRSFLGAKVPGANDLNSLYSSATDANGLLKNASGKSGSAAGITGRILATSPAQATETYAGRVMGGLGKYTAGTANGMIAGPASQTTRQLVRQVPGDVLAGLMNPPTQSGSGQNQVEAQLAAQNAQNGGTSMSGALGGSTGTGLSAPDNTDLLSQVTGAGSGMGASSSDTGGQYDPDTYVQAAMQALASGDTKSYTTLMGVAGDLQSYQAKQQSMQSSGSGSGTTQVTAQNFSNAQQGMTALQSLSSLLQQNPNVLTGTAIPGQGLPVIGGFLSNAAGDSQYNTLADQVADMYLRLTSGAGTTPAEMTSIKNNLMPRAGDSQQTIQTKLNNLYGYFNNVVGMAQQGGTSSSDPTDQLAGLLSSGAY